VTGNARSLLKAERVALNFFAKTERYRLPDGRICGNYRRFTGRDSGYTQDDTGMRLLEKYAVSMGGGRNHRFNLSDGI